MDDKIGRVVVRTVGGAQEESAAVEENQNREFGIRSETSVIVKANWWYSDR